MTNKTRKYTQVTAAAALLGLSSTPLLGAGFQLAERSVSGLGRAFSGEAAIADDATVISSNPAGMILLEDGALSVGLQYINPNVDVKGNQLGSTATISDNDVASDAFVPYTYYSRKINDNLSVGFGLYSSFGLATEYSKSFASLVGTETSEITTVTLNPSLAYRVNEQWTVGVGIDVMYAEGKLTALNTLFTGVPGTSFFSLEGDDWAIGWNAGVLFELSDRTRFGLHYRSSVDLHLEGDANGSIIGGVKRDATLDIELPDSAEFSAYHELNDQWAIHADVVWTNWSKFKQLTPKVNGTALFTIQENWEDAFRYAIGTTYKHSDKVTFRAGLALDETPVGDSDRTLRIPDGDRVWASIGATIKLSDCYNLDIAYTHLFADDTTVGPNELFFNGTAGGDVDIFGIGISGTF